MNEIYNNLMNKTLVIIRTYLYDNTYCTYMYNFNCFSNIYNDGSNTTGTASIYVYIELRHAKKLFIY